MPYACFGNAPGVDRPVVGSSRRHLSGRHGGPRRAYRLNRAAVDDGRRDCERSRYVVAGHGARQHGSVGGPDLLSLRRIRLAGRSGGAGGVLEGGWGAGGSGGQPVSAHRAGQRVFVHVRWAARYANGSNHKYDGSRSCQSHRRKDTRRSDFSVGRGKEGAEDSQSNRPSTALTEHTASGRCSGAGRAQDGPFAPRHEDVHGAANGGQRRTQGIGPAAGNRSGVTEERRTDGGDQLHVQRRPGGQGEVQGAGTLGAGQNPHQTSVAADGRRECVQPGIAQRQAAGAGNDLSPTRGAEVKQKTMATLPAFYKKNEEGTEAPQGMDAANRSNRLRPVRDPFQLRALPHEHLFLYNKRIDNSRLVREADPKSRGACWSAIGAACVLAILLTSAFAPSVATTIAGYKLEALRIEERRLLDEHRGLDLQEAELLSRPRLDQLARQNSLVAPSPGQVFHLEGKPQGAVAMAK